MSRWKIIASAAAIAKQIAIGKAIVQVLKQADRRAKMRARLMILT